MNPFATDLDTFLRGYNTKRSLDISPLNGSTFEDFLSNHWNYIPTGDALKESYPNRVSSNIDPTLTYVNTAYGTILYNQDLEVIGAYLWSSLTLSEDYHGRGIGRELIIVRVLNNGSNPVADTGVPAYSPAGLAAHKSAWRYMKDHDHGHCDKILIHQPG